MTAEKQLIEVGVAADAVRYWRAKEAMRQAEAKMAFQATSLAALEARATSLTGWAVAGATAMASALMVAPLQPRAIWAATGALVILVLAAAANAAVLFPGRWTAFGDPIGLLDSEEPNELVELEVMAGGLAEGIERNGRRLDRAGNLLAAGIILLALAPGVAVVCGLAQWLTSS